MRKIVLLAAALSCLTITADITWISRTYDFGSFREEAGPQKGEVKLVNTGTEPTAINRVKSTCGCTVAGYTEGIINPGDTAKVWFTYNPTGRPGRFEKHIKVYTGTDNDVTSITLKGTVIGSSSTLSASYPVEAGQLRLSADKLNLGKVTYGRARHEYISGYNASTDTLHLEWSKPPRSVSLGVSSKEVAPGDIFTIGTYFNTRDEQVFGPVEHVIKLYPQYPDTTVFIPLTITADILPDTARMSEEELRMAPSTMLYPTLLEMGTIAANDTKPRKISFKIVNEGKTPLHVHRVCIPGSKALKIKQMPTRVAPGKEHEVKAELLPEFIPAGPFALEVQVITNDPLHPSRHVKLAGIKE